MIKQTIHIIDFKILYNILDEIKDYLKFQILHYKNEEIFLNSNDLNLNDSLILVRLDNKVFLNNEKISRKKIFSIPNYPITIDKLVEILNVNLIKQKYNYQSNIDIKDYKLDLNSRTITKNNQNLKLTQKEIDIILFLNGHEKPQKVSVLQNKVWGYSLELETHTVETHIYRLRKKIKDKFKVRNIILRKKSISFFIDDKFGCIFKSKFLSSRFRFKPRWLVASCCKKNNKRKNFGCRCKANGKN